MLELDIATIITSYNRAMQLDGLLTSIKRYAPALWPPTVTYHTDGEEHVCAYEIVRADFPEVHWLLRRSLKEDILNSLTRRFFLFLMDDSMFYKPLSELPFTADFIHPPGMTNVDCIRTDAGVEFSYLPIEAHVYLTSEFMELFGNANYANVNFLEDEIQALRKKLTLKWGLGGLVNIPHNFVQHTHNLAHIMGGSADELNRMYLEGWRLDPDQMDFSIPTDDGIHADVIFKFKQVQSCNGIS